MVRPDDRLAEATEKIAWLQDAVKPPAEQFIALRRLKLSPSEKTILYALWTENHTLSAENLRRRLDVVLGVHDERSLASVRVAVARLRKSMLKNKPPIEIGTEHGVGYYMDDKDKALLSAAMVRRKRDTDAETVTVSLPPLPIEDDHWRSRWLVNARWRVLHRISAVDWDDDEPGEMIAGYGNTVCGLHGRFTMPGFVSRMSLKRCNKCCKALGIPAGDGAPFNVFEGERASV